MRKTQVQVLQEMLREQGYEEWTVENSSVLTCPHGHRVEWDGECPEGCESPVRQLGMI